MKHEMKFAGTMDRIATVGLAGALGCLFFSFNIANELGAAVSFGAFVSAFVVSLSAYGVGHLAVNSGYE